MSGLFFNKVAGALLASGLGIILINKFANVVMEPEIPSPEHFAYSLAVEAPTEHVEAVPVAFPSPAWLEARDATKGAKVFKKCKSCHSAGDDKKDGTGPHLWGVVGRPKGSVEGFKYSDGMKAKGGVWTYEDLDTFLTKPKDFVNKTKMSFNGLKKETDRAALIEFLRTSADTPMAQLTAVVEAPAPEGVVEGAVEGAQDKAQNIVDQAVDAGEKMAGDAGDAIKDVADKVKQHAPEGEH